ncbi:MAG: TraB/GumN family protein [Sphingomonadaceae bacterium]|nr:TraB/GumN family protein [Sphingomonadaceae bacterium]
MKILFNKLATGAASAALLFSTPAFAESDVAPGATPVAAKPALWKVADEDTTIYLFGTVHILPKGIDWAGPAITGALAESDELVTEIPTGPEADATMQQLVMSKGMLPQGGNLRALLSEEDKATFEAALGSINVPAPAFDAMKPWMAGLTLTVLPLIQQGYSLDAGVEEELGKLAGPDKPRGALETIEYQLGLFDGMDQQAQVEFMIAAAETVGDIKPMLDSMVAEWAEGDADGLAEIMNREMDDPAVAESLLYTRNGNWAEWIDARLDTPGTVFIAVGAGHLAGERSVQDLLAQRGITTARVQ